VNELTLRPAAPDDCGVIADWLSRPELNRWLGSEWRQQDIDPRRIAFALKNRNNRFFVVLMDGDPSGLVAFSELDAGDGLALLWYLLGNERFRGRGIVIMAHAVELALDHAFGELGLTTVYAWVHPENLASLHVLERVGFKHAGRLRAATVLDGVRADRLLFDVTRSDWPPDPGRA